MWKKGVFIFGSNVAMPSVANAHDEEEKKNILMKNTWL